MIQEATALRASTWSMVIIGGNQVPDGYVGAQSCSGLLDRIGLPLASRSRILQAD